VLAAQGVLHDPFAISRVDRGGQTVYQHTDRAHQAIDPKVAYIMADMLSKDENRALIFGRGSMLNIPNWRVAVKTGTSDSFADAWTVGFTPKVAVAVWMGNPDWRVKMTEGSDSYYVAVPAWHAFFEQALPTFGPDQPWYQPPQGLISIFGNYYLPGTVPDNSPPPVIQGPGGDSGGHRRKHGH
jgi:membrane peptidoglycan carboxypeptidase